MQIPGSPLPPPAQAASELSWSRVERVVPLAPGNRSEPLIERPVTAAGKGEVIAFDASHRAPVRMAVDDGYARRALAAYESVQRLERRDDLHALMGVDDYA